jgi:large subunit ribosomal protein L22
VRLVADFAKGLDVSEALIQLDNLVKGSSFPIKKLLESAVANAENNLGLDKNNLYVYDIQVGEGMKLKRWLPRAFGRASLILKRSSSIVLTVEERVEGKNRKSKEQLEKERKEKEESRKKMEKEIAQNREKKSEEEQPEMKAVVREEIKEAGGEPKKAPKGGWMKKVFRRKSM